MKGVVELKALIPSIRAVIFDLDGVLVDSEAYHFESHRRAVEEVGGRLKRDFYIAHGVSRDIELFHADIFPNREGDREFFTKLHRRKEMIYQELLNTRGIRPVRPAIKLVKMLYALRIPLAVGTAVHRAEAMRNLRDLGITHYFSVIVTGDDLGIRKKPAPDIYVRAEKLLGLPPNTCLVIEDSGNGVKAALGAGCNCVAVPGEFTKTHDFTGAIVVSSFEEIRKAFGVYSAVIKPS